MPVIDQPVIDECLYSEAFQSLTEFHNLEPDNFRILFLDGQSLGGDSVRFDVDPLKRLKLLKEIDGQVFPTVAIVPYRDQMIVCDPLSYSKADRIFPVHEDESLLLAEWCRSQEFNSVLDIGTGSGVAALSCASAGANRVIASDINLRSKSFVELNSRLNGFSDRVTFISSNIYDSLPADRSFDCIVCNPPFVPLPLEYSYFTHSHGGPDGLTISRQVIQGMGSFLNQKGTLCLLTLSLMREGLPLITDLINKMGLAQSSSIVPLYDPNFVSLYDFYSWMNAKDRSQWMKYLSKERFDGIGYFTVLIGKEIEYSKDVFHDISESLIRQKGVSWPKLSYSFEKRILRYG